MPEIEYRASRFCRIMGNPTAYQVVKHLVKKNATPQELAEQIGLTVQTISDTLRNLRNVDIVRYETLRKNKIYFLKDKTVVSILDDIERLVARLRIKKW
jgi:DNA-binding transcriptional ArsR family regulator